MKKLPFFAFGLGILVFMSGCGQPFHKSSDLGNTVLNENASSDPVIDENDSLSCRLPNDEKVDVLPVKSQPVLDEALNLCDIAQDFWQKGELENALESLDQAYALILNVNEDNPKFVQQKEDLRFLISKRILEIYASRNTVVNGKHNEIPLVMNRYVQAEIDLFTKGRENNFFCSAYQRSGLYREYIVSELKAAGIPEELSWLPLIESGYKVNALSKARALGLWQFIPSTGYKFGLKRDKYIDERMDPAKSTQAAIAYLKELHNIFGDWSTVLAAYNCGEGRVLRVIRDQNINYLDNFWDLYEKLPQETARYVPRFLATLHVIQNPKKYGVTLPVVQTALSFDTATVSKQVHLKDIADRINVPVKDLKDLNPELRYNILPNEDYTLRLPKEKSQLLIASIEDIPVSQAPNPAYAQHIVRTGETLTTIANKYGTSVSKIISANNLGHSNRIASGNMLNVPLKGTRVGKTQTTARLSHKKVTNYKVKSGDSLYNIAKRFGTTTKAIQKQNKLSSNSLQIGQKLKIPVVKENSKRPESPAARSVYVVKNGDSPFGIASKHKMSLSRLLNLNSLSPKCKIFPGQQLFVE